MSGTGSVKRRLKAVEGAGTHSQRLFLYTEKQDRREYMANPTDREHRGTPWWLWALGVLILVGLIWLLMRWFDPTTELEEGVSTDSLSSVWYMDGAGVEQSDSSILTMQIVPA
jgi:hypothetical protein